MKEFLAEHAVEVGIVITAITAIGVFVGPWFASWWQRKNTKQDRKLRTHFEEVKREAEDVISYVRSLAENDMRIVFVDTSFAELGIGYIEIGAIQISDSFKAHFPRQTKEWRRWEQKATEHNKKGKDFCQKIKTAFESKGIPVEKYPRKDFCCIYEDAFDALFNMWGELAQNKPCRPDFQKINSEQADGGYFLRAQNWASAVAFAKTEDDKRKCKLVLAEIADDIGNQGEAAKILDSANKLVEKAREFANQLDTKLDEIDKYWPGTQTNEFKRLKKNCPKCKELFRV